MMIKRIFLTGAALTFAFGILVSSVIRTAAVSSDNQPTAETPRPTGLVVVQEPQKINYFLAYPGILPDHFLYPIKMIRDKISLFLTFDSLQKSERMVLYADKRLGAARALIEGNKTELGVSTALKGEKYLEQAVSQAEVARQQGKDVKTYLEKLSLAILKHQEVLLELTQKVPAPNRSTIEATLELNSRVYGLAKKALGD